MRRRKNSLILSLGRNSIFFDVSYTKGNGMFCKLLQFSRLKRPSHWTKQYFNGSRTTIYCKRKHNIVYLQYLHMSNSIWTRINFCTTFARLWKGQLCGRVDDLMTRRPTACFSSTEASQLYPTREWKIGSELKNGTVWFFLWVEFNPNPHKWTERAILLWTKHKSWMP
jgi:hypothetical protein